MGAWEDGFAAGWRAREKEARGLRPDDYDIPSKVPKGRTTRRRSTPKKRAASASQKRYGREFKRLQSKYKKKSGGWKKDGFKRCAAAARKAAKQ